MVMYMRKSDALDERWLHVPDKGRRVESGEFEVAEIKSHGHPFWCRDNKPFSEPGYIAGIVGILDRNRTKAAYFPHLLFIVLRLGTGQSLPSIPALIMDDDSQVRCCSKPPHHIACFCRIYDDERILKGMKDGTNTLLSADLRHVDGLTEDLLAVCDSPGHTLLERYLDKQERLCPDVVRPDHAIS
jgi:hypothetical protein